MNTKKDYTKRVQQQLDKYKDKLSKIDDLLERSASNDNRF